MSRIIEEALRFLEVRLPFKPEIIIILGSGLGALAENIENPKEITYSEIPNFPQSTVKGHDGKVVLGTLSGKNVMAFKGRFHFYEGYTMEEIALPVRLGALLGATKLIVSNACGGVNPEFEIGDIMLISDHINLFPSNPLIGPNRDEWGRRFPDMSETYSKRIISEAEIIASELNIKLRKGVYAGLTGPCLETPAEYKYIRIIGADAVGMSTVPEVIAAHHMGIEVFGLSVITDLGVEGKIVETTHEEVVAAAQEASKKVVPLVTGLLKRL
jgi:purine-nucleoside phosphorylase